MKTYEEMAQSALNRIRSHRAEQKQRRKTAVKIAVPAASFCLAAVLGFGAWQSGIFRENRELFPETDPAVSGTAVVSAESSVSASRAETVSDNGEMTTADTRSESVSRAAAESAATPTTSAAVTTEDCCIFWWKNKRSVSGPLYQALQNDPSGEFAVTAVYRPATATITSFVYEGKTLAQWATEAADELLMPERMMTLLKLGDSLKYGAALYETGTPSGEKWARQLYEETVADIGEELLNRYIVDGVFLREELERDIAGYHGEAGEAYDRAWNAYLETVLATVQERLTENHIRYERTVGAGNDLKIFVTAEELENLPLPEPENWYFGLAGESSTDDTAQQATSSACATVIAD